MARLVTVAQLMNKLDLLLDAEEDGHITTAMKLDCLNCGYAQFWDYLVAADLSDHMVKTVNFTLTPGQEAYALATVVTDGDFYKVRQVYVNEGNDQYRPLPSINEWYLQSHRPPSVAASIRLDYIPCAPVLAEDDDTVDGINGWEELIVAYAAIELCRRRQEDPGWLLQKAQKAEERIIKMAIRDVGFPDKIIRRNLRDPYGNYSSTADAYRLRGTNIEIYRRDGYLPV